MSEPVFKVKISEEKKYVVQNATKEEVVRIIAAKGEDGANFEPTIVSELPETGDSSKLYLTPKSHTTQTASGNPITINITEGAGEIDSLKIDGDTYQQSYEGKNILPNTLQSQTINGVTFTRNNDGSISIRGTATARIEPRLWQSGDGGSLIFESGQTYFNTTDRIIYYYASGYYSLAPNASFTVPTTRACSYAYIRVENGETIDTTIYPQVIKGSTAADYEPFVGGQPSPSPSYPQPIQTVTGEQTITINSTDYHISLGSIELCKLDTYQDYIYKDGNDWKIRNNIAKVILDGSEDWGQSGATTTNRQVGYINAVSLGIMIEARQYALMSGLIYAVSDYTYGGDFRIFNISEGVMQFVAVALSKEVATDMTEFVEWLESNNQSFYYVANTPTDTTITDQTLIAQLEAIRTASLQNGTNTITNTAAGSNLAGDMELGYHGYNPTNRYDKFIWLDTGWESL